MHDDSASVTRGRRHGRDAYRRLFLASVAEHRHHVLDDLADVVLPSYREAILAWDALDANRLVRKHDFWHALGHWQDRFHLSAVVPSDESSLDLRAGTEWLRDAALATLGRWRHVGGTTGRWELKDDRIPTPMLRTVTYAELNPDTDENSNDHLKRTMRELRRQVAAANCDVMAKRRDWRLLDTTPEKRVPELHAAWTARYQVPTEDGTFESYGAIAATAAIDPTTGNATIVNPTSVESAVTDFAAAIGLARRPATPGRPRKSPVSGEPS